MRTSAGYGTAHDLREPGRKTRCLHRASSQRVSRPVGLRSQLAPKGAMNQHLARIWVAEPEAQYSPLGQSIQPVSVRGLRPMGAAIDAICASTLTHTSVDFSSLS
jgi:hypothetical protein